ncbi:MAG TPA: hypothetical protein VJA66_16005 [Thermoanaerobaculia bacterium]
MIAFVRTVNAIVEQARITRPIRKSDLRCGDCVVVNTENSTYSIRVLEDSTYSIRGGWFDRQGMSPVRISISGCTWGGTVIRSDILAACGLHLEFGNRVVTSRIRDFQVIRERVDQIVGFRPAASGELLNACYGSRLQTLGG